MLMRPFDPFYSFSPWREMERLRREMNRLFATVTPAQFGVAPAYPAMNVWTNEEGAIVTAELPGVQTEDIDISVEGDTLTLRGDRQPDEVGEDITYHRRERGYGRFVRTLRLPFNVEPDKVEAIFKNGVLRISLPRAEAEKPRKITVKTG